MAHAGRRLVDLPGHQRGQDQLGQARQIADQLPADDPNRLAMQIAPRTLLCGNTYRIGGTVADTGFDDLRELCTAAGDKLSLAIGMTGLLTAMTFNDRITEAAKLATECAALVESIGDPALIVALLPGPMMAKGQAGEMVETLRLAQRVIDLADGDATMGNLVLESPLALAQIYRGIAESAAGKPGSREHSRKPIATARPVDPLVYAYAVMFKCFGLHSGCSYPMTPRCGRRRTPWRSPNTPATPDARPRSDGSGYHPRPPRRPRSAGRLSTCSRRSRHGPGHQAPSSGCRSSTSTPPSARCSRADFDGAIELARAALESLPPPAT